MTKLFFALLIILYSYGFADRAIYPIKLEHQNEFFVHGASVIQSNKQCFVTMFQTVESLEKRRANFYFHFINNSDQPKNLLFQNLKVYDQNQRPITLVHKRKHIEKKKSDKNWKLFASLMCGAVASANADKAGDFSYSSHTNANISGNAHTTTNYGKSATTNFNAHGTSNTYGTVHCEALRQEAIHKANDETNYRNMLILDQYRLEAEKLSTVYFDSNTVFQGEHFQAGFQIEVPYEIEKELEHIFITLEVDDESHTFCFFCEPAPQRWSENRKDRLKPFKGGIEKLKERFHEYRNKKKTVD